MQIIPVIDLMGATVVHAQGGSSRADYPSLQSLLTPHSGVFEVISALQAFYPFETVYIADLQAIETGRHQFNLYQLLTLRFPQLTFWIDAGIQTFEQLASFSALHNAVPVVGSETLVASDQLTEFKAYHYVLSLDFRQGEVLGNKQILTLAQHWPDQVIVMDLDAVGRQQGPGLDRLKAVQKMSQHTTVIASGGVRNKADLLALQAMDIQQVLVASALHNGQLSHAELKALQAKKSHPTSKSRAAFSENPID